MKQLVALVITILFATSLFGLPKKKVVIGATIGTGVDTNIKELFMTALHAGLTNSEQFDVIAYRNEYAAIIRDEMDAMEAGLIDDNQLLSFGRAKSAEKVVYAHIVGVDQQFFIYVSLIELESGISEKTLEPMIASRSDIMQKAKDLANIIANEGVSAQEKPIEKTDMVCHAYPDWRIDISNYGASDWKTAVESCEKKGLGWRLPTREELSVIYKDAQLNPSSYGARWQKSIYWTTSKRNNYSVFTVDFSDGTITFTSTTSTAYYRCIRDY